MVFRHTELLVFLLTAQAGCFREPPFATIDGGPPSSTDIRVHDRQGTPYPERAAPRDLTLVVALPPPRDADALALLPGAFADAFAARVATGKLPARIAAEAVPFTVDARAAGFLLRPTVPLAPGASYTLLLRGDPPAGTFRFTVSNSPGAGARLVETLPSANQVDAPPNLARVLVRFDGHVEGALETSLSLHDAAGVRQDVVVIRTDCSALGLAKGTCVSLHPTTPLKPRTAYQLSALGLTTDTTAPIADVRSAFETGSAPDHDAPSFAPIACTAEERAVGPLCALFADRHVDLRGGVRERALVHVASERGAQAVFAQPPTFTVTGLPIDGARALLVRVVDLAGHAGELRVALAPPPALATLAIDEVRADPEGKEPAQEYVELLNFGTEPMPLTGCTLSTDKSRAHPFPPDVVLAPGERALVVGPAFDPDDRSDGPLPDGVRVVRLASPLSLANDGVALFLRDRSGLRLSAAPALTPFLEGQCIARRAADPRTGARDAFARDPEGGCTPGRATSVPP